MRRNYIMQTKFLASLLTVFAFAMAMQPDFANAQKRRAPTPPRSVPQYMQYEIIGGDTVYMDVLNPSVISRYGKRRGREWRKYYKLVWNFNKTYPYALVARKLIHDTDSAFATGNMKNRQKEKYVNALQKELFNAFEEPMKNMTISQGQLLMKLIDREVGISSYDIIREYKTRIAAGFWQGVARVFGTNMKKHYDPDGEDKATEELVKKWESGEFPSLYFSIFGEYPKNVELPSKYRLG